MNFVWNVLGNLRCNDCLEHHPNYEGKWKSSVDSSLRGKLYVYLPSVSCLFEKKFFGEILVHYHPSSSYKPNWKVRFLLEGKIISSELDSFKSSGHITGKNFLNSLIVDQDILYIVNPLENMNHIRGKYFSSSPNDKGMFVIRKI